METNLKRAEGVSLRVMTTTLYNVWSNKDKNLKRTLVEYTV
jgi:hypothetical protein